jgi:hypothetical protein
MNRRYEPRANKRTVPFSTTSITDATRNRTNRFVSPLFVGSAQPKAAFMGLNASPVMALLFSRWVVPSGRCWTHRRLPSTCIALRLYLL